MRNASRRWRGDGHLRSGRSTGTATDHVVNGRRTNLLVILLHEASSRFVNIAVLFRSFAGSKAKSSVVALRQHAEEQKGKDRLGEDVQDAIP